MEPEAYAAEVLTNALADALHPFTPTPVDGGFTLTLAFEGRANDPLAPGADAIEAHSRFKRVFRECALKMARVVDPAFELHEGETSEEDADPSGAEGWELYGDDAGGLYWFWGCTDHAADETMFGRWSVRGLTDGKVALEISRRYSGTYKFDVRGAERAALDAAKILGDTLRALKGGVD